MAIQGEKAKKKAEGRREVVARFYKQGWSLRKIQEEVIRQTGVSCSHVTIKKDVDFLLKEWRENRIEDIDYAVQLELERINDAVQELWVQWEKSKTDYKKTSNRRKGKPVGSDDKNTQILTIEREINEIDMRSLGDVSYISEIRAQLIERRKLLGLYAPEKRELTGKGGKDLHIEPITIEIIDSRDRVDAKDTDNDGLQ
ncbi:MAG: hypothetical protein LBQ68_03605 [Clostridiales bacterium]|jgi:hypothetical protein|nr:hypothetical protein [Clostridiales bacterium]